MTDMISPVVSVSWWQQHRGDVVLADVRWYLDGRSGRAAYDAGHLPGAVFVDLDQWLAGPHSAREGRHPLPSPEVFAGGMAQLGVPQQRGQVLQHHGHADVVDRAVGRDLDGPVPGLAAAEQPHVPEIGRASCRERV